MMEETKRHPAGELLLRTLAMPADANPKGDIFGGWIMSQMDIGGGIMAKELAPHHITVNALAPGPFVSKMTAFATADEGTRAKVGDDVPLGRVGRDEDIAGCMQFLCGMGGAYLTGAVLPVSGGIQVMSGPNLFRAALGG